MEALEGDFDAAMESCPFGSQPSRRQIATTFQPSPFLTVLHHAIGRLTRNLTDEVRLARGWLGDRWAEWTERTGWLGEAAFDLSDIRATDWRVL